MSINICDYLYQAAREYPLQDRWVEIEGSSYLLAQSPSTLSRVLGDNSTFIKDLSNMVQVVGESRITLEGDAWQVLYRASQPLISNLNFARVCDVTKAHVDNSSDKLANRAGVDHYLQIREIKQITARVMSQTVLGTELENFGDGVIDDVDEFLHFIRLNTPHSGEFARASGVEAFRALGGLRLRWLNRFENLPREVKNNRFFRRISEAAIASGAPISAQQEILFLLGAGSDTSAVSVGWAMLFLADHPEIQRQLRQSLSQHWTGNEIDASAILKEPSLEAVLQEVMCLYPSVPMVMRKTTSEAVVAGYKLPTSQRIILSFIGLGLANSITNRNEESCLADLIANIQPDDRLMRFGHGPRKCGGRRLALVEISIILACLVQRFEFVRTGSDEVRPVWQLSMTCAGGIPVSLKEC